MGINIGKVYDLNAAYFLSVAQIRDLTQQRAINTLVTDLKGYGVWDKMKAIYPFIGRSGVSSSYGVNLKEPTTFRGIFSGSWNFNNLGATPDGLTAYMDTGLSPSLSLTNNNTSIGIYNQTPTEAPKPSVPIGTRITTSNNPALFIRFYSNVYQSMQYDGNTFANYIQVSWGANSWNDTKGFWLATRTSSTVHKAIRNGTVLVTNTTTNTHNISGLPGNIFIGANSKQDNTAFGEYDSTTKSFAFIGDGLTDTEAANLYTAVQKFQTTLGRQV
jgi:hypothetical protein